MGDPPAGSLPTVAVVISTRDRSALIEGAVASVLALDRSTFDLDLVVVDDGSVDDTTDVLAGLPVRVVRTTGLGIAGARNTGVYAARSEFLQLLDDDDRLVGRAITAQLEAFAAHPEYGAVFGRAQRTRPDLTPFGEPFPGSGVSSGWILDELVTYHPQIGTALYRRDAVVALGGYNPRYGVDEWDLHLRLARAWPIGRIDDTVLMFRQREEAEEEQQWRRTRHLGEIFDTNVEHLSRRRRLALRPAKRRMRGWNCYQFVQYAVTNWRNHEYRRALRATYYATRWSPLHVPVNLWRLGRAKPG